jgi:hypothetical protein
MALFCDYSAKIECKKTMATALAKKLPLPFHEGPHSDKPPPSFLFVCSNPRIVTLVPLATPTTWLCMQSTSITLGDVTPACLGHAVNRAMIQI